VKVRPALLVTAGYEAGLATGLLHFGSPLSAVAVLLAALTARRPPVLLVAAALTLGRAGGELARLADHDSCAARLPAGRVQLVVRLVEPVGAEGGAVQIGPLAAGCRGEVAARWPRGSAAAAGLRSRVEGFWLPRAGAGGRAGGTLVVRGVDPPTGRPGVMARLRTLLGRASLTLYGGRAPLVDALMLGRRGGIDRELQDRFAQSGLVHLLSISGFHVGLIAAWVFLTLRLAKVRRTAALAAAAVVATLYVGFIGWPAPATRAAALAVILARCRLGQRHVRSDELLAATCLLVLIIDPWAAIDLGGWLSAAALWGATRFSRWTDRALGRSFWWRTLGSSVGATLATAPITAWSLGSVAPVGIVLNFAAIPIAAVAVPGVLASLLLFPLLEAAARPFAAGAGLMLHLLELIANAGARIPAGHVLVEPFSPASTVPWLVALFAGLWCTQLHNTPREAARRTGWVLATVLCARLVPTGVAGATDSDGSVTLHFLDVGQGDAAAIRTPAGRWLLVDAGPAGEGTDAGRRVVAPFLARHGARALALAIVSHVHADHLGGLPSVMNRVPTALVVEPGADVMDPRYTDWLGGLLANRVAWHPMRADERMEVDGVRLTALHPTAAWDGWGRDVNEDSLVLLLEYGDFQALFAGDAGFPAESAMAGRLRPIDLLKVGHHGSRGSTGDAWLAALRPSVAVISVGRNDYGHPAPAALARLAAHGVAVHRTDQEGTVTVTTDGHRMTVASRLGTAAYDVR
jgi:competence protein ComEC